MPPKKPTGKQRKCAICGITAAQEPNLIDFQNEPICPVCFENQRLILGDVLSQMEMMRETLGTGEYDSTGSKRNPPRRPAEVRSETPAYYGDDGGREPSMAAKPEARKPVPTPKEIHAFLNSYVVGQEDTKKVISVAVHNHYKRLFGNSKQVDLADFSDIEIEKSNILLLGPTGSGKTLIARTLARMLDVPFAIADATTLTEAGYVGEDVENILLNLMQAADMDIERAKTGIVFIDEIDKIGRRTDNVSITRDVSGEGVQQALLKILEGTVAHVPPAGGRKHPEQRYIEIDTKDILFICGGAFVGLDTIMRRRAESRNFGFTGGDDPAGPAKKTQRPEPEDLIQFGLIPEFVGRLPVVSVLEPLTEDDLVHILTKPRNCLTSQYRKLFAMENIDLKFEDSAIRAMAVEALKRKTGARGLRSIIEELMLDVMYEAASEKGKGGKRKLTVTGEMVKAQFSNNGMLVDMLRKAGA